jgi:hypothetical protein
VGWRLRGLLNRYASARTIGFVHCGGTLLRLLGSRARFLLLLGSGARSSLLLLLGSGARLSLLLLLGSRTCLLILLGGRTRLVPLRLFDVAIRPILAARLRGL